MLNFLFKIKSKKRDKKSPNGFTLIELLVAIAIIGVLAAVLLANMVGVRERGADAKIKSDLNQLRTALRLYYNDNQTYPQSIDAACSSVLVSEGDGQFSSSTTEYMKELPEGCRYQSSDPDSFVIYAPLNNEGDPAANESAINCGQELDSGNFYVCSD